MSQHQPSDAADDEMIARLSRIAAQADPVPELLLAAARNAFGLRELDARVVELMHDSAVDSPVVTVRGPGAGARLLSFEAGDIAIECEISVRGNTRDIIGQLVGAEAIALEAQIAGVPAPIDSPVDEYGRFSFHDLPGGVIRLRGRLADETTIVTSWTPV